MKNGILHKRPRLTKLTEASKKAGYKSQGTIATALGISTLTYCSYESGKKEMPKDIAEKLSALLNMPVKEIMSVDYAKEELSKEATDLLDKVFKLIGDLDYRGIRELNHSFNDIHKENGFIKYLHIFRLHLIDMGKKKSTKLISKFNDRDANLLFKDYSDNRGYSNKKPFTLDTTIKYDSVELLLDNGLLEENQLKDFIKYFNIVR